MKTRAEQVWISKGLNNVSCFKKELKLVHEMARRIPIFSLCETRIGAAERACSSRWISIQAPSSLTNIADVLGSGIDYQSDKCVCGNRQKSTAGVSKYYGEIDGDSAHRDVCINQG